MFQLCACHSDIPQYNSSETFRNVPLLLSHVCLCAVRFDGYDKTVAILTNDDLHLIDISISYDPACDEVYHWAISDYPVDEFSYSDSFWNSVIAYAENHFEDSDLVLFTTTIYDTSDSSVDASLSSESNLR